jgi:hypothetical protein
MEGAMTETLEEIALVVGDALVTPSLGDAELILAAVVALAFLWGAIRSLFGDGEDGEASWRQRRS